MSSIGYRLSRARRIMNMNQKEVAKKANVAEASLSRYENDIREPSSAALVKLANALNTSTDYILGISCEMDINPVIITNKKIELEDFVGQVCESFTASDIMINGEPACDKAADLMMSALRMGTLVAIDEQKNNRK